MGITAIYGQNGAGKSGYSRVLRRACRPWRAEDLDPIQPDVTEGATVGVPEAQFDVRCGNAEIKTVLWKQGAAAPSELASFAVFDASCVQQIIGSENTIAYQPAALRLLPGLAQGFDRVRAKVTETVNRLRAVDPAIERLPRFGEVGQFVGSLTAASDPLRISALIGDVADVRRSHEECGGQIHQLIGDGGPARRATKLDLLKNRLKGFREMIARVVALVDDAAAKNYVAATADREAKRLAAEVASRQRFDTTFLTGTGGEVWKQLFDAARTFSIKAAYPGTDFPAVQAGARCVWCQQALDAEASERLRRFNAFMQDQTARSLTDAEARFRERRNQLTTSAFAPCDPDLLLAIRERDAACADELEVLPLALTQRRDALIAGMDSNTWGTLPTLPPMTIIKRLQGVEAALDAEAKGQRALVDPVQQKALTDRRDDLHARLALAEVRETVQQRIANLRLAFAIEKALGDCTTNALTMENGRRTEVLLNARLQAAIDGELATLEVDDRLRIALNPKNKKAQTVTSLALKGARMPKGGVPAILSEGEQRVLAIAAFMAELELADAKVGIIFDDPVTSLDHRWSERFARRIAEAARDRQVVIFTHDIAFFCALKEQATEQRVHFSAAFVARRGSQTGHISDPPWETLEFSKRLLFIDSLLPALDAAHRIDPSSHDYRSRAGYAVDLLRSCWERAVEEKLLYRVVERFRPSVQTERLKRVIVDEGLFQQVYNGMTRTSRETPAHDRATRRSAVPPSPESIRNELVELRKFDAEVGTRGKAVEKKRKALTEPPEGHSEQEEKL